MKKLFFAIVLIIATNELNAQRTYMMISDVNKAIIDSVAKDFEGFKIKEAIKVVKNDIVTYEFVVIKGTTQETILYDSEGRFIREIDAKKGTTSRKNFKVHHNRKTTS